MTQGSCSSSNTSSPLYDDVFDDSVNPQDVLRPGGGATGLTGPCPGKAAFGAEEAAAAA